MTFEEYLSSLKGKTVGVIGVGVSNRPLIEKLLERGIDVTARDKKEDLGELGQALTAQGCKLRLGSGYLANLHEDVIFRTPGLRPDVPELAAAVAGGSVITAISSGAISGVSHSSGWPILPPTWTIRSMWMQRQTSLHTRLPAILLCSTPTTMTRCVRPRKRWTRSAGSPGNSGWTTAYSAKTV